MISYQRYQHLGCPKNIKEHLWHTIAMTTEKSKIPPPWMSKNIITRDRKSHICLEKYNLPLPESKRIFQQKHSTCKYSKTTIK
jgi:hypothetical protein